MTLTGFGVTIIVARGLGPHAFAAYVELVAVETLLVIVGRMGCDVLLIRRLAREQESRLRASQALSGALFLSGLCGLAVALGLLVFLQIGPVPGALVGLPFDVIGTTSVWVGLDSVRTMTTEAHRGMMRHRAAAAYGNGGRNLIALLITAVLESTHSLTLATALGAFGLATALLLVAGLLNLPLPLTLQGTIRESARFSRDGWKLAIAGLTATGLTQGTILVSGLVLVPREVAAYGAAARVGALLEAPLFVVNLALLSLVARAFAESSLKSLERQLRRLATYGFALLIIATLGLVLTGPWLLAGLFGAPFSSGYPALCALASAQAISMSSGSAGLLLTVGGENNLALAATAAGASTSLILAYALGDLYGISGVAAGVVAGVLCQNLMQVAFCRRKWGVITYASWQVLAISARTIYRRLA